MASTTVGRRSMVKWMKEDLNRGRRGGVEGL
jgi:hypothetical protein